MGTVFDTGKSKFQYALWIFFILTIIICLLPIIHVVSLSFSSKDAISTGIVGILPVGINIDAYKQIFKDSTMITSFLYSMFLTLVTTVVAMVGTILVAFPLSKKNLKGGKIIMTLIIITMYFDPGIIPKYLVLKQYGLIDTMAVLIIPNMISAYNLIILKSFFSSINSSLYEAAYIDGCGEWKALFKIGIPLAMPAILTLSLFYAVSRWNGVSDVIFYINDPKLYTLQFKLKQMLDIINLPYEEGVITNITPENIKSASLVFSMVPMLIIYPFIQKYFTKGMMLGGVKE